MSWIKSLNDSCSHIKNELKRCLGLLNEKDRDRQPTTTETNTINNKLSNKQETVQTKRQIKVALVDDAYIDGKVEIIDVKIHEQSLSVLAWKQLVSGGLGGLVSRTSTAPFDRLKIMMQASAGKGHKQANLFKVFHKTLQEGGVRSLWRGNMINCMKVGPECAIRLFTFENVKLRMGGTDNLTTPKRFVAGATAGVVAQLTIYPMEVIRTRMVLSKTNEFNNFFDCTLKLYRSCGPRGFYRGIIPSLIGIVPNAGIDLCVYETLKQNWMNSHTEKPSHPSYTATLISGGISSICSMFFCYPFALVRTNLQAQTILPNVQGHNEFATMINTFKTIVRDHGIRGLYRGILPNCLKVVPACSISYLVYEKARKNFGLN